MIRAVTFLGASCVGKTSVFEFVKKDKTFDKFTKVDSITRQLVREGGISPSFDSVPTQRTIFDKYLEVLHEENYISDRSVIDVHTFTRTLPYSVSLDNELRRQSNLISLNEYYLPVIFYFPIYWNVENDGERLNDESRRRKWDSEIRKFLMDKRLPYEVIPNDTPFNRVRFIKGVLSTRMNLC